MRLLSIHACCVLVQCWWGILSAAADDRTHKLSLQSLYSSPEKCPIAGQMLPACKECVPGTHFDGKACQLDPEMSKLREHIQELTTKRFGYNATQPYALYPYLQSKDFTHRQEIFGEQIGEKKCKHVVDIGSYYEPIVLYINRHCPESVVHVEPVLEPLSTYVPCADGGRTHVIVLPTTSAIYAKSRPSLPVADCVVCVGCDVHYGPQPADLVSHHAPFTMFIEFAADYRWSVEAFDSLPTPSGVVQNTVYDYIYTAAFDPVHKTDYRRRHMKTVVFSPQTDQEVEGSMALMRSGDAGGVSAFAGSLFELIEHGSWSFSGGSAAAVGAYADMLVRKSAYPLNMEPPKAEDFLQSAKYPHNELYNGKVGPTIMRAHEKLVPEYWFSPYCLEKVFQLQDPKGKAPKSHLRRYYSKFTDHKRMRDNFVFSVPTGRDDTSCEAPFFQRYASSCHYKGGGFTKDCMDISLVIAARSALQCFMREVSNAKQCRTASCRGGLVGAGFVLSSFVLYAFNIDNGAALLSSVADVAGFSAGWGLNEDTFVDGYLLASLGRHILHPERSNAGDVPLPKWQITLLDTVMLQNTFMRQYSSTFGVAYSDYTKRYIPMALKPSLHHAADGSLGGKKQWAALVEKIEPVHVTLRWMWYEADSPIDFGPQVPLVAFEEVRSKIRDKKRILIETGANGFFASPKYLLDTYAAFMPFTDIILIEPEAHYSIEIPDAYAKKYKIAFLKQYLEVGTGTELDIANIIKSVATTDDYVVLKFDVDVIYQRVGLEWPFIYYFIESGLVNYVDELYIEMHFSYPLTWGWPEFYHSNWEAFDMIRYIRSYGIIVHAWP